MLLLFAQATTRHGMASRWKSPLSPNLKQNDKYTNKTINNSDDTKNAVFYNITSYTAQRYQQR